MTQRPDPELLEIASARTLVRTTGLALVVAAAILITVVLPAEYGIDPLHTGAALGLTRMSARPPAVPPVSLPAGDRPQAPEQKGPIAYYPAAYKVDAITLVLGPYEFVEYKYHLEKGAVMSFAWSSDADLIHDFHGDPDNGGAEAAVSYEKQDRREAAGTFAAPFAGIHGWYWENPGGDTVTVSLTTAGFYTSAIEFRSDRTRRIHELQTVTRGTPARPPSE